MYINGVVAYYFVQYCGIKGLANNENTIKKVFSGPVEQLARFRARAKSYYSVFMTERWPREPQLHGCTLVRIHSLSTDECTAKKWSLLEAMSQGPPLQ